MEIFKYCSWKLFNAMLIQYIHILLTKLIINWTLKKNEIILFNGLVIIEVSVSN